VKPLDWFSALTLFECIVDDGQPREELFELRVIVVQAEDETSAREKAEAHARHGEPEYENADGGRVTWVLREVLTVEPLYLDAITDGDEVFSAYLGKGDAKAVRQILARRAS